MGTVAAVAAGVSAVLVIDGLWRCCCRSQRWRRLGSGTNGGPMSGLLIRVCALGQGRLPHGLLQSAVRELEGIGREDAPAVLARWQGVGCLLAVCTACAVTCWLGMSWAWLVLVIIPAAYAAPVLWLAHLRRTRVRRALAGVPELLEYVACCSDAGLALLPALELAAGKLGGPLGHELRMSLARAHGIGGIGEALRELSRRLDHPIVSSVTASLVFAERLGTPVASLMRRQGSALSTMRRQVVGTRIGEASSRLAVCAVFLLLPATLAVIIVPNVIGLMSGRW